MKIEIVDQPVKPQELLPQIVDRIFSVCKSDPSFHLKDELEIIENKIISLQHKINRQNSLMEQSDKLKKDIMQRIEIIDEHNQRKQVELLESIGSEL